MTARRSRRSSSSSDPGGFARALVWAVLCACAWPTHAWAQGGAADAPEATAETTAQALAEAEAIPEYDRVRTPSSPALSVLGVSPSAIERATTPRDFAIVVASTLESGAELTVPKNVALEVAPYWFLGRERSTYDDYLKSGLGRNALRNLAISVGSTSREVPVRDDMGMETGDTVTESDLAVGLATQLYTGKSRADVCGGKVQEKTRELAKKLAGDDALEDAALADKELLARARGERWRELVPLMQERDAARKELAAAAAVLADKDATPEARVRAEKARAEAEKAAERAQGEIARVAARASALVQRTADRLAAKKSELLAAAGDQAKADLAKQVEDLEKQLERAFAAAGVAEQAATLTALAARARLEDAETVRQEASSARTEARDKRIAAEYASQLAKLKDICKDASAARLGWNVSMAGALAWRFPESKFSDGELHAASGWLTVAHTFKQGLSAAALARLTWTRVDDGERATLFDTGARLIFARARYAVSGEAVVRTNTDQRGVRAAVIGEYMVSKGKWLSLAFGKDFSDDQDIFTLANLTWGVGGESRLQEAKDQQAR